MSFTSEPVRVPDTMKTIGLLMLVVAVWLDEGATCSVSSPQCYKNTTRPEDDFLCKWEDLDPSPDAIYTIFIQSSPDNDTSFAKQFNVDKKLFKVLPVEDLLTARILDIWVVRQVFDMTCSSPTISVLLNNSVKYNPPDIKEAKWSAGNLTLKWPKANDNKGAIHEIRWKKINNSWKNTTFETEDNTNNGNSGDSYTLQLQEQAVYQVQIRRKAKQSILWSDWSQTSDIPTEIQQPVVHWDKKEEKNEIVLKWDKPPPEASFGGVSYNLTLILPCKKQKNKSIKNYTFTFAAIDSEARVSIVAINNVGSSSPREIIIPPEEHLKYCHGVRLPKGKGCLEWYKLVDGETRPAKVNITKSATLEDIKKGMEKFVRYYYFLHTPRKKKHQCPIYSIEGAPSSEPKNVTVLNITQDSAVIWWRPIPVQEQQGFLMYYNIWISREGYRDMGHHQVPANETSFLLRNLAAGSFYTLSIAGGTKIGAGPNSTSTFFTLSAHSTNNRWKMDKIILIVCAVVLLVSIAMSVAIRRLRSKLLPIIPSPVISASSAMPHMNNQDVKTVIEEVDDVILLCRDDRDKKGFTSRQERNTSLQDCEFGLQEDDEDEDEEDEDNDHFNSFISSGKPSSYPNPNYKGQLLRFPELLEISDKSNMGSCDVGTPLYKNGLFFETKCLDSEEI